MGWALPLEAVKGGDRVSARRSSLSALSLALAGLALWGCSAAPTEPASPSGAASPSAQQADLSSAVAALKLPGTSGQSMVATTVQTSGDWALVTAGPPTSDPSHPVAQLTVVIAHRVGGAWQVVSESDTAAFCAAVAAAPSDLVTSDERDYFVGCR
jgi:hypothetical protein